MKPHIRKVFDWWACEIRLQAMQPRQRKQVAIYCGTGSTPYEAYERCQKVFIDRNKVRE